MGQGGTAEVYKALQTTLERPVAIKILLREVSQDPEWVRRFRQEAHLLGQLDHPHILPIYDAGEFRGRPYLVMKYVADGVTLRTQLTGEPWPLERVVQVVEQVAEALHAAHQAGIVHRDVKPSNILVTPDSRCMVFDFGIAKPVQRPNTLTGQDFVVGTPEFMSPEQCRGDRLDPRTDVYALGVMTYQMLTGHVPFAAETPIGVLMKHLTAELPIPPENVDLTPELNLVLSRVLARSPRERYATAREFKQALFAAAGMTPTMTIPSKTIKQPLWKKLSYQVQDTSRRTLALGVAGTLALLLMGVFIGSQLFSVEEVLSPTEAAVEQPGPSEVKQLEPSEPVPTGDAPAVGEEQPATPKRKKPLLRETGFLLVESVHPAAVFLDGRLIGTAPGEFRLPPGDHHLKLDAGGDGALEKDIIVFVGQTTYVKWHPTK
jgi:serine/threonine protein kinase